jgi:hypothetical protein
VKAVGAILLLSALGLAGCSLAGDITPPPALATAQAAETLPPVTVAPTERAESPAIPSATVSGTSSPAEPGTIRGLVTNGTPGGSIPGGIEVMLSGFDGDQEAFQQTTTAAVDGTYVFTNVPAVTDRVYGVTVAYEDVLYFSDSTHLTENEAPPDLSVTVYETTTDTAALSIERLHVLFDFAVADQVQVIELWVISNSGDRTVVGAPSRGIIEVSLPAGATDLAFEDGSTGDRYIQTADGFGDTEPVIPGKGTSQFIFSYWLPYDGSLTFLRPSDHPINAVVVLLPQTGVTAQGTGLQDLGAQQMSGQAVHTYEGGAIPAGQTLEIELKGQPQEGSSTAGGGWTNIAIGLGALAVLLIVAGLWWFRPRVRPSRVADSTEALVDAIAGLDDALDAGRIDAAEYRERRDALKRQLRERMGKS